MHQATRAATRQIWTALRALNSNHPIDDAVTLALMETSAERLVAAAIAQGVGPGLADSLRTAGAEVPASLREQVENARFARAASIDVVTHLDNVLGTASVPWVVLKGPLLSELYPQPDHRPFKDIDILVRGRDLERTIDVLQASGFRDVNQNWGNYLRHGVAETPIWGRGMGIDLHWHVIGLERRRLNISLDINAMIERRRPTPVGSTSTWTLDPADMLLHVALHAGMSGATRLIWLRDIRELARVQPPDWNEFVERVARTGVSAQIGQVLDRARLLVGADIPPDLPEELCGKLLLRLRRSFDDHEDGSMLPGKFARALPVVASGDTASGTARELASQLLVRALPKTNWNVGAREGPLYWDRQSGGPESRRDYMNYAAIAGDSP